VRSPTVTSSSSTLSAVSGRLPAGLTAQVPRLLAGAGRGGIVFVDVDDTIGEVHRYAKQAAAYGYSGVRGLNLQLATVSTPIAAPLIARARLRRGNSASARGAGPDAGPSHQYRPGGWRRRAAAGPGGLGLLRLGLRRDRDPRSGVVLGDRTDDAERTAAIASIGEDGWTPICYRHAVFDEDEQRWVCDAEVAEVGFAAFTGRRKRQHVPCRLVVRRVKRLSRSPPTAPSRASCSGPTGTTPSSPTPT
jgi:hypothetical protein